MADAVEKYDHPALSLKLTANHGGGFSWKLEMEAPDASGSRVLSYRASGSSLIQDLSPPNFAIEVHDEARPVWTEMPASHRKDVRDAFVALLGNTLASMKAVSSAAGN